MSHQETIRQRLNWSYLLAEDYDRHAAATSTMILVFSLVQVFKVVGL